MTHPVIHEKNLMDIPVVRDFIAGYWLFRRHVLNLYEENMAAIEDDRVAPFDEFSPCLLCGSDAVNEEFITQDKMRVCRCDNCELLQTVPRIKRATWEDWLKSDSSRGRKYTENRLRYGYALDEHIKYSSSLWRWRIRRNNSKKLKMIFDLTETIPSSMHDIGCGVGFFLQDARKLYGLTVSGNDLNRYAVDVMRERYDLDVVLGSESDAAVLEKISNAELITMTDVIEHLYDPLDSLKAIYSNMRDSSMVFITTFHIDCRVAEINGPGWDMHCWNHITHYSRKTLEKMVETAGFKIKYSSFPYDSPECKLLLEK